MLWSSCTRTLLRCSRCFSIPLSRLSGNPTTLYLLKHCFPMSRTLPSIYVRFYSNSLARLSYSLVVKFFRKLLVYLSRITLALASLLGQNPRQLWLLHDSTI